MTVPENPNPLPDESLSYRDGREDVPSSQKQFAAAFGLGFLSFGIVAGVAFIWIICNLRLGPPSGAVPPLNWGFPALCSAIGLFLIGWMAYAAWRKGSKVIIAGICIGVGLCLLCEGLCLHGGL